MDNSPLPTPASTRLRSLDALRGLCAGVVFLSHWHLWSDFAPQGAIQLAVRRLGEFVHDGVSILTWPTGGHHPAVLGFFVLSGFCIHYPFERRALAGGESPNWPDYFRRRFLRIVPVYWAACLLGLVFVIAETQRPAGSALLMLHASGDVADFFIRVAGLAGVYPREIFAGNYILTTVTVEIFMYAAYPWFYRFALRGHWRELTWGFLALHVLAIGLLRFFSPYWVFNSVLMLGIFWHLGALAAHEFLAGRGRVAGIWLLGAWAVFLGIKTLPPFTGLNLMKQAAWAAVCTLGILWVLRVETRRPLLMETPPVRFLRHLGTVSYSLYAIHTPAIMLVNWSLLQLGSRDYLLQLAATMVASIAATLALYYGIERMFYRPRPVKPAELAAAAA